MALVNAKSIDDLRALDEGGNPEVLTSIIRMYLDSSSERILNMATAIRQGNVKEAARDAHSLKSSLKTLGADEMATLCEEIENQILKLKADRAARLAEDLKSRQPYLVAELKEILDTCKFQ